MGKPTERALKRKPQAVILLTTRRSEVPKVPNDGREFEWFDTDKGRKIFFDQNVEFHKQDTTDHDDMAYLAVEITDTAAMKIGRIDTKPETDETKEWAASVKKDITEAFMPVKGSGDAEEPKKVVKPRAKSQAAKAGAIPKESQPEAKAGNLRERLAAKKAEAAAGEDEKSEPAKEEAFVVKKAATSPS